MFLRCCYKRLEGVYFALAHGRLRLPASFGTLKRYSER